MERFPRAGSLLVASMMVAAAVGAVSWLDALFAGLGAVPPLGAAEYAELAARDGAFLLPPVLASALLIWIVSCVREGRDKSSGPLPGGRTAARDPILLTSMVLSAWAAALVLLYLDRFSIKVGWLAADLLAALGAGWAAARLLRRGTDPALPRSTRPAGAAAAMAAGLTLWAAMGMVPEISRSNGAGAVGSAFASEGRPGVILIVVDALRADHLGAYGYSRPTSPALDRWTSRAVRFDDVVAPSSWTLPSMASILTSSYPGQHGVVDKGDILAGPAEDLASRLRNEGYRTAALTTNPWLKRIFGFDDGFTDYFDLDRLGLARNLGGVRLKNLALRRAGRIRIDPELVPGAEEVTSRALDWLRWNGDAPFFLYLHYMDVHAPYDPVEPYRGRFCGGHSFDLADHLLESKFRSGKFPSDAAVREHVIELYDEDILAMDAAVGRLIDGLSVLGLEKTTAVFFTADHGEEFYEHGRTTHGHNLYQTTVHVPLIVELPEAGAGSGRVVRERVSTLDLFPTILDVCRAAVPAAIEGRSLAASLKGEEQVAAGERVAPPAQRAIGSQLFVEGRAFTALFVGGEKLIRTRPPASDPTAASLVELYHVSSDPAEKADVARAEGDLAAALTSALDGFEKAWGIAGLGGRKPGESIDPETLRQLKALGYIN